MAFDPAGSTRKFHICMTDISKIVLFLRFLNFLREHGPGIQVENSKISPGSPEELSDGRIDLAVGFMSHLEAGFYQQKLFDQHSVCLVSSAYPRVLDALSLEALQREDHVVVRSSGTGHAIVDKVLKRAGIEQRVALQLPSFLGGRASSRRRNCWRSFLTAMAPRWRTAKLFGSCRYPWNAELPGEAALARALSCGPLEPVAAAAQGASDRLKGRPRPVFGCRVIGAAAKAANLYDFPTLET